jgi:muramoyltetrapeptide carboxypeptidase
MKFPPYLRKGDTIGMVAPAGYMPIEKMQACIETLDHWGYNVELGATTHSHSTNYFSGTDNERLDDLQQMLDNKKIAAILCARGGYGISRIIDQLDFKKFRKHPKWVIGFSDITVLHSHLYAGYKISSIHAPMAAAFNDGEQDNLYIQSLREVLEGEKKSYECAGGPYNQNGTAEGELVGGNLSLLAHLIGTPSEMPTKNRILFLEDIGEYLYNVDRMLLQLKRAGKLDKLAGLIIGGFTDNKDTERPYGKGVYEIIHEQVKEYDFPVCFGFPVSHEKENVALKIGGTYELSVKEVDVCLREI